MYILALEKMRPDYWNRPRKVAQN